ncbi:MAG: FAD-binding oxidoreductase [Parvularculaceae bacterium]|nr:FAD-binding oxidoreductase [Parvularculaceae bacterium]
MTAAGEHVRSWYAATANPSRERPPLAGEHEADICVIGGGFTGVSAALTLAERGRSVILLEANRIGWGASGRNGGQVLAGWSGEGEMAKQLGEDGVRFLRRTKYRGHDIIEERIAKYEIACDYARGSITVAANAKQQRALAAEYEAEKALGADHFELLDDTSLRAHVATDAYCGGLIDRRGAHCHPLNLCLGEAQAAEKLGVRIFERTEVSSIDGDAAPVVRTAAGSVRAKFAILAGNAYHKLAQSTLRGAMLPAQTFMIATERLGPERARDALPDNLGVCDANWVLDYFRRTSDDRLLFGGRCTYSNREIIDIEGSLLPRLKRILPQLGDVKVDYAWGGAIGIPLNRVPLIGKLRDNLYYAQGYSGHGVNCSHIAGEILADAIEAKTADIDLFEAVRHFRIPAATLVGNPLLAMGMTWFRMRDVIGI